MASPPPPKRRATESEATAERPRRETPADPRAWSATADGDGQCNIYTIRAFLGDPDVPLPSWIKTQKKGELQEMLRDAGIDDISGGKDALLQRYQTGKPFVEYRIDGRECLQRVLIVCLDAWGWDEGHLFRATMPNRGSSPWGAKKLRDLQGLMDVAMAGEQSLRARLNGREGSLQERHQARLALGQTE